MLPSTIIETSETKNIHPVQETTMIPAGGFGNFLKNFGESYLAGQSRQIKNYLAGHLVLICIMAMLNLVLNLT